MHVLQVAIVVQVVLPPLVSLNLEWILSKLRSKTEIVLIKLRVSSANKPAVEGDGHAL